MTRIPPIRLVCALAVVATVCTMPSLSSAQGAATGLQCAPEVPDHQRRLVMPVDGRDGVWVDGCVMRCMVADLNELPLVRQRVGLLEEQLSVRGDQVERLRRALELSRSVEIRLETARKMLQAGKKNITEVAYECGFNSSAYLSSSFADRYKITPSEYQFYFQNSIVYK